jgi:bifunctional non-homologous end joining protein LigD
MLSHPRILPAGFIAPCPPMSAPQPPSGEEWLHEIKHDGFRVIARSERDCYDTRRGINYGGSLAAFQPLSGGASGSQRGRAAKWCVNYNGTEQMCA